MDEGNKAEQMMKRWFKGFDHTSDSIDFQTKNIFYEVKSCKLFTKCCNQNQKREFKKGKPHKKVYTSQTGRFHIYYYNHLRLKSLAEKEGKIAKYLFVLRIGNQKVWRVKRWDFIDAILKKQTKKNRILLKDIFFEGDG